MRRGQQTAAPALHPHSPSRAEEERVAGAQASANLGFVPGPALSSCGKSRPLPEPQFPHLSSGDNKAYLKGLR